MKVFFSPTFFFISTFGHFVLIIHVSHFDLRKFRSMQFRLTDFSVLCHFDLCTFLSYVISTFGHFNKNHFDLWTFRTNVISNFGLCHLDSLWYFDLRTFRPYVILTFGHFPMSFGHFVLMSYRPLKFSF